MKVDLSKVIKTKPVYIRDNTGVIVLLKILAFIEFFILIHILTKL